MRTFGLISAALAVGLAGCGDDARPGTDGGIMLMDGGRDGGGGTDAARMDSGGGTMCTLTDNGLTGAACFPRCTAATAMTISAMGCDGACQQAAVMADTTPPITIDIGGMPFMVTCQRCFNIQINSCVANGCPTQFEAFVTCEDMTPGMCTSQEAALDSCIMSMMMTIQTCVNMRAVECFP